MDGSIVLKYGMLRSVFGAFTKFGDAVELPCYDDKMALFLSTTVCSFIIIMGSCIHP